MKPSPTQEPPMSENEKSLPCPFCGATPHHGLTKVEHCQLHGEPFQRFRIWCPRGHATIEGANQDRAAEAWNRRAALTTPCVEQDADEVERVAFAIIKGSSGLRAAEHAKEFQTANWFDALRSSHVALSAIQSREAGPVNMLLFCPHCHAQHVDEPSEGWDNPPHRSHLCHACGCIWRPADVATNGVASIETKGTADNWDGQSRDALPFDEHALEAVQRLLERGKATVGQDGYLRAYPDKPSRDAGLREALKACLDLENEKAKSRGFTDCCCLSWSPATEQAYENGLCPHQKARAALQMGGEKP